VRPSPFRWLGCPVDTLFEACAADDLVAVAEAGPRPREAVLVPERGDSSVELTELGGEDDVVSLGQTVQKSGAVLACALDLGTDFGKCSHVTDKRRSRLGHSLLLIALVLAGCGGGEKHQQIAYGVVRDDVPTRIVVVQDDGKKAQRVTGAKRGASPVLPTWSPDGERIAFVRFRPQGGPRSLQVYVVNADGSNERQIGEGTLPSWTPDGRFLVVERPRAAPQTPTIHVLAVDGGGERKLANGDEPALSHDGKTVAFVRSTYVKQPDNQGYRATATRLYTIALDGTKLHLVAKTGSRGTFTQPSWLPDDTAIAVLERRGAGGLGGPLWRISLNGRRRLVVRSVGETYDWSPKGDLVAYTAGGSLYIVRPDGTEVDSFGESNAIDIEWSPDGTKIAFSMMEAIENAQYVGLYLIDLDKDERRRFALADGFVAYLDWRPEQPD
jgi:TolB protein